MFIAQGHLGLISWWLWPLSSSTLSQHEIPVSISAMGCPCEVTFLAMAFLDSCNHASTTCDTGADGHQEASCVCCLVQDSYIPQMTSHPLHGPENGGGGAPQWWDRVIRVWDTVRGWFLLLGLPSDWSVGVRSPLLSPRETAPQGCTYSVAPNPLSAFAQVPLRWCLSCALPSVAAS